MISSTNRNESFCGTCQAMIRRMWPIYEVHLIVIRSVLFIVLVFSACHAYAGDNNIESKIPDSFAVKLENAKSFEDIRALSNSVGKYGSNLFWSRIIRGDNEKYRYLAFCVLVDRKSDIAPLCGVICIELAGNIFDPMAGDFIELCRNSNIFADSENWLPKYVEMQLASPEDELNFIVILDSLSPDECYKSAIKIDPALAEPVRFSLLIERSLESKAATRDEVRQFFNLSLSQMRDIGGTPTKVYLFNADENDASLPIVLARSMKQSDAPLREYEVLLNARKSVWYKIRDKVLSEFGDRKELVDIFTEIVIKGKKPDG
ncbi:MAG: hypothetical protein R3C45_21490 [Phycisphaerales bacterium]